MSTIENPMRFAARGSCAAPAAGRRWAWRAVMLALGPALAGWHGAGLAQEEVQPVATAQTRARPDATLPGVTVTAKGYAAERESTPMATSVVGSDELARRQAQNVGEALRNEPGLSVNSDSAQGQNPVIRGLKRDSIVLLVDGMRFNSAQPMGAVASFMSLGLAERVEVVKGPSSVLYGTGALGGVIDVQLPQARFKPGLQARGTAGFDSASRGWNGAAVLNAATEDHALMLGASLAHHNDYHSPDGKVARTGYKSQGFIGQYRFRIDGSQQLRASVQNQEDKDLWYPAGTRPHANPRVGSVTFHSPRQYRRLYEVGYSLQGSGSVPMNLDVRVYRQEMKRSIYGHANGLGRDLALTDVTFATDGLDVKTDWEVHPEHLLSAGVNLWRMRANPDSRQATPPTFARYTPTNPFRDGQVQALGIYVQDDMHFGPLNVLAGLRHDRVKGKAASMNNGRVTTGLDRSDGATSASLGAVYEISPLLRPYLNVSRAFRAADLRERYQSGPRSDGFYYAGSPKISPETATQIELGLKGRDERLEYTASVYRSRINDYITGMELTGQAAVAACGQVNAAACKQNLNLGHVTLTGADAGLRWQAMSDHWLRASWSMVRGENDDLNEPLFQMPADRLALGWDWRLNGQWMLDADWTLVKRQKRVATRFTRGGEDPTPGYALVDVGATWQFAPQQSVRLAVRNVGDKRYHDHLAEGLTGRELLAPGRSLLVSWQGSF